jgi:hypothetical protein
LDRSDQRYGRWSGQSGNRYGVLHPELKGLDAMKRLLLLLAICSKVVFAQWTDFSAYTAASNLYNAMNVKGNFQIGAGAPTSVAGTAGKDVYFDSTHLLFYDCTVTGSPAATWALRSNNPVHVISIPIAGSPIVTGTGSVGIPGPAYINYSCTINRASVIGNISGSITVAIWKVNAAIPTSGNIISSSAPVTLATAQLNQSSSLAGWTLSVAPGDVFWATVVTVDGVLTSVSVQLSCQ